MVTIRQATVDDWQTLVTLDQAIFGTYGAQEEPAIIKARLTVFPAGCAVLEDQVEMQTVQTQALSAPILGYLTTEKWATLREPALDEDPELTHDPAGKILNITTLAVAPEQQNRGLGVQLLTHARQIAYNEGCTEIVLETAHAVAFYQRHRFTQIGERSQRNITLHIMHQRL